MALTTGMFDRLLVPVDGSIKGYELAERAIELAVTFDAELHAVFVKALAPGFTPEGIAQAPSEVAPSDIDDADDILRHVGEQAATAGVAYSSSIKRGERHLAILNAARDARVDLIVLRLPDRRYWRRLPLTTTDRVVRKASTSVLTLDV